MLERECEAVATYVGDCLSQTPAGGRPLSAEQIALFVGHLSRTLQSLVRLTRKRLLDEVSQGRRAIPVSLQVPSQDCPIAQAADFADIDMVVERLTAFRERVPKMFAGYAMVREDEAVRVLYPAIQHVLDAVQEAFEQAEPTPEGCFIQAESENLLQAVLLHLSYPAYYVYEVFQRPVDRGAWKTVDRTGRDQLVALLADAYHKGHWFTQPATSLNWHTLRGTHMS